MNKLTQSETIEAEKQEMIKAKKQALLQEDQRQKRLRYIPALLEFIVLIIALCAMYLLMYGVGFVTGWALKECKSCPHVQSVCELPPTWATP